MAEHQNIIRDQDPVWRHLTGVEVGEEDQRRAHEMRMRNPLRHVDHIGLGCRDAETTRQFYEDILGMPLVLAVVLNDPYAGGNNQEYCHFFFEVGNGTFLAFFDHPSAFTHADFRPRSAFLHHIAIEVTEDATVQEFRRRLEEAGADTRYTDHGVYHSLYFTDPNGHNLEITYKPASHAEFVGKSRKVVREVFKSWVTKRSRFRSLSPGEA
jgi:catechol 2,3-dioxygenase-like lactoylglutathione lyase family enzyme